MGTRTVVHPISIDTQRASVARVLNFTHTLSFGIVQCYMGRRCLGTRACPMGVAIVSAVKNGGIARGAAFARITSGTHATATVYSLLRAHAMTTARILVAPNRIASRTRDALGTKITNGTGVAMQTTFVDGATLERWFALSTPYLDIQNRSRRRTFLLAVTVAATSLRTNTVFDATVTPLALVPSIFASTRMARCKLAARVALFGIVTAIYRGTAFGISNFTGWPLKTCRASTDVGSCTFAIARTIRFTGWSNARARSCIANRSRIPRNTGTSAIPSRRSGTVATPVPRTGLRRASSTCRSEMGGVTSAAILCCVPASITRTGVGGGTSAVSVAIVVAKGLACTC